MHYRSSLFDNHPDGAATTALRSHRSAPARVAALRRSVENLPPEQPAVPGRPRRRKGVGVTRKRRRDACSGVLQQCSMICSKERFGLDASLCLAIFLWYSLGVLSIASSKILLTGNGGIRVNPLALTLQQLFIGATLLRFLIHMRFLGSPGLKPWPPPVSRNDSSASKSEPPKSGHRELLLSAICFALGFLATNFGFAGSAASFVETVKAAEPLTSATVAALYGIEIITTEQKASLGTIVAGVVLSTVGGSRSSSSATTTLAGSVRACIIVMASNLCFSFRGLYQKLLRKLPSSQSLDDLNLQFRMQWFGVLLLALPTIVLDWIPNLWFGTLRTRLLELTIIANERQLNETVSGSSVSSVLARYFALSLFNGMAFTCYNLASTWILSRISVVHHAALNCIRRVFAIIVTSVYFGVPITLTGAAGIALAVIGFMAYTHYKVMQQPSAKSGPSRSPLLPLTVHEVRK
jgi:drug/metabolite transporter (DMT)-like permease